MYNRWSNSHWVPTLPFMALPVQLSPDTVSLPLCGPLLFCTAFPQDPGRCHLDQNSISQGFSLHSGFSIIRPKEWKRNICKDKKKDILLGMLTHSCDCHRVSYLSVAATSNRVTTQTVLGDLLLNFPFP